jgi:hypothetical protein
MFTLLSSLTSIIEPGVYLTRSEVLKRYRLAKDVNAKLLQWLMMLQFSTLVKNEKGELFFV